MQPNTVATAIAALEDMIEAYKLSGYSKKDMDEVRAAIADLTAAQQADSAAGGVGLDMPTGPGWWARDGSVSGNIRGETRFACFFPRFEIKDGEVWFVWGETEELAIMSTHAWTTTFGGKWYRLHMPWDSAAVGEWMPVTPGTKMIIGDYRIQVGETWPELLFVMELDMESDTVVAMLEFPDDIRLCKRAAAPQWTNEEAEEWRVEAVHFRDKCIEYEHRIRELEQPVAMPVEVTAAIETLCASVGRDANFYLYQAKVIVGDWLEQAAPPPVAMPSPDWSKAPEWANWWCVDHDGRQHWHEREPMTRDNYNWWLVGQDRWGKTELVQHPNWRTLKQRRPGSSV